MYTKQEIILRSYREGESQRSIARSLEISRKTVRKYIEEYNRWRREHTGASTSLTDYLSAAPVYRQEVGRSKVKLTQDVVEEIDKLLAANEEKKRQGLRKQVLKKCDIHEQLVSRGFTIGYTTVCNYIRSKQITSIPKEAFIRQSYRPGESCEFDWGEVKIYVKGKQRRVQLAVFTSAYSNYRYAGLYERQDTLAFMESHVDFFEHTGGVYGQMVYDNMRVAVAKFVGRHEKEPTQALLQLRGHYLFSHRFCNAYSGNEKGHVERSVEYIRRKAFGVKCHFENLKEAEEWLMFTLKKLNNTVQQLKGKTAEELFVEEQKHLMKAPPKLACADQEQLRVDKYATISYRTNRYSVPDHLVGQFVTVKISSHRIEVYEQNKPIASHERSYQTHDWVISIHHYLNTFRRKPGALANSVALASSHYLKQLYQQHFREAARAFIDLLIYCREHQIDDEQLEAAVNQLQRSGVKQITGEKIQVLLGNKTEQKTNVMLDAIAVLSQKQLSKQAALMN